MLARANQVYLATAVVALFTGCSTSSPMKIERPQLTSLLESELINNTGWVRIHAAEGLLDHGQSRKVAELFGPEANSATPLLRGLSFENEQLSLLYNSNAERLLGGC